ncbi:MAG TPA: hypothetical protein VFR37_11830 [Longimicrobium sp.]|nr:hypothetical protein [Longimicrobium sp.]
MMEDHRKIPLEVLRDFAITRCEMTSTRAAAVEAGIGRTTLAYFITGQGKPHPRVLRLLGLWYLRKHAEVPDADIVRPYSAGLAVLLAELPEGEREQAEAEAIAGLCALYDRHNAPRPRWLGLLSDAVKSRPS